MYRQKAILLTAKELRGWATMFDALTQDEHPVEVLESPYVPKDTIYVFQPVSDLIPGFDFMAHDRQLEELAKMSVKIVLPKASA